MDNLDKQLKADAEAIPAEVSPELAARLQASIRANQPIVEPRRQPGSPIARWVASSLTGVAALMLLIVFSNRDPDIAVPDGSAGVDSVATPVTEFSPLLTVPLDVRTADFAEPLAEELENLKSDLEKAREKLGDDLRFTL